MYLITNSENFPQTDQPLLSLSLLLVSWVVLDIDAFLTALASALISFSTTDIDSFVPLPPLAPTKKNPESLTRTEPLSRRFLGTDGEKM